MTMLVLGVETQVGLFQALHKVMMRTRARNKKRWKQDDTADMFNPQECG